MRRGSAGTSATLADAPGVGSLAQAAAAGLGCLPLPLEHNLGERRAGQPGVRAMGIRHAVSFVSALAHQQRLS